MSYLPNLFLFSFFQFSFFLLHFSTKLLQLATLKTKETGPSQELMMGPDQVNFRKDFWDCYQGREKQLTNSWPTPPPPPPPPVSIPETTSGHISAPVLFSFLKWWTI